MASSGSLMPVLTRLKAIQHLGRIRAKERQGGSVLPIHPPTTTFLFTCFFVMSKKRYQFEVTLEPGVTQCFKIEANSVAEAKRLADRAGFLGPVNYKPRKRTVRVGKQSALQALLSQHL